jgi:hypothetical protein
MEKKKRRKPEIGTYDVVKVLHVSNVIPVEPVMHMIKATPVSKEPPKVELKLETVDDVKKKRNSCFLC